MSHKIEHLKRRLALLEAECGMPSGKPASRRTPNTPQEIDMRGRSREVYLAPNGRECPIYFRNEEERRSLRRLIDRVYPRSRPRESRETLLLPVEPR